MDDRLHWMVVNIDCAAGSTMVGMGKTVASFIPSSPPPGTGFHRYVFLLYKQMDKAGRQMPIDPIEPANRGKFDVKAFADKWGLMGPVKAIHYKTEDPQ